MSKSRRARKSRNWSNKQNNDQFVQKARAEGFRARAAYKLEQIDRKYRLILPRTRLADLGSSPGSWTQYALTRVETAGQIVAVDLLAMPNIPGIHFIEGDFTDPSVADNLFRALGGADLDLVLSDMAPNITGIRASDDARAENIQASILLFCSRALRPGGCLLTKVFEGAAAAWMRRQMKHYFAESQVIKPDASRSASREIYILGRGYQSAVSDP